MGVEKREIIVNYTVGDEVRILDGPLSSFTGTVEAIAAVLALTEGLVPPTINYKEADPELDLDYTPNTAVKADLELAMSSNLGFGGHNAVVAFKKA